MQIPLEQGSGRGGPGYCPWVIIDVEEGSGGSDGPRRSASMPNLPHSSGGPSAEEAEQLLPRGEEGRDDENRGTCGLCQKVCPPILTAMKYGSYGLMAAGVWGGGGVPSAVFGVGGMMMFESANLIASCLNKKPRRGLPLVNEGVDHVSNMIYTVGNGVGLGVELGNLPVTVGGVTMSQLINIAKGTSIWPIVCTNGVLTHRKPCRTRKECLQKFAGCLSTGGLLLLSCYATLGSFLPQVPEAVVHGVAGSGICLLAGGSMVNDCASCCGGQPSSAEEEDEVVILRRRGGGYGSTAHHTPGGQGDCVIEMGDGPPEEEDESALAGAVFIA